MFAPDRESPDPTAARAVCGSLAARRADTMRVGPWQSGCFAVLAESGVLAGFIPRDVGGTGATEPALLAMLVAIAEHCLATALALTQWAAACRIIDTGDPQTRATWLPPLARGEALTTVGISQLTTSRRHLATAALTATADDGGWRLDGLCPWVTGAESVHTIVTGAATDDGGQRFFIVPTDARGLAIDPPLEMLALSESRTSAVHCTAVRPTAVIAPAGGGGPRTGGLSTTALAIGATRAAIGLLDGESARRPVLEPIADQLRAEADGMQAAVFDAARAGIDAADRDRLRAAANGLVVRAAQAALTACKGAGFVAGHPAERLVRESMFFLVWSCPQAVTHAVMCELAGM